ncbi:putative mitochondrial hypothetical protein [Leptomonas pyrrhocoris]|uniref:Uncharacterized protein n=1 Tax=Leptomonas pyrrhocoris TaxID=157538 RepID=A0A0N0DXR1_LEPPY|nr:putative mitochondrial hypothetical protein [Leptomonas pyrrhocoris]KPA83102.1 putative mitochondrial hypothetical protein [Leptomonas pyrrhocoris]|eukprot:XP_015661541.1 putative mitochondrial hypothetical protein [Leptomonas pyrrhocoris]
MRVHPSRGVFQERKEEVEDWSPLERRLVESDGYSNSGARRRSFSYTKKHGQLLVKYSALLIKTIQSFSLFFFYILPRMLRLSSRVCGSYVLNQRVIGDWWQPRYRERAHNAAKEKLNAALQEGANDGRSPSPPGEADTAAKDDGASPLPSLSLYDANALVATFVSCHNTEDLSATLQYIREHLGQELTPFHFHALLRNFNHHRDMHNALQLLEVMVQSGTMTLETYARMADCIHVLSPPDTQARILQLVGLAQEAFGGQVMAEEAGSEGATTAMYSHNEEGRRAREAQEAAVSSPTESSMERSHFQTQSAPLLSSLLHHLSTAQHADAVASCFLVALWISALGVELSDWDVLNVLSTTVIHAEQFPRLCMLFGHFEGFAPGHVSVQAVLDRLSLLDEVSFKELSAATESAGSGSHSAGGASSAHDHFVSLVAAMRRSLTAVGGDGVLTAVVPFPLMNAQTNDMEELLLSALRPLMRDGVGAHRYNAGHLLHVLSLVSSTARDDLGAVQMLVRSIREQELQEQKLQQQDSGFVRSVDAATVPSSSSPSSSHVGVDKAKRDGGPAGEPFAVPVQHLLDMATLLNRTSASMLREVQQPLRGAIRRLVGELPDGPSGDGAADSWTAVSASCSPPIATARDLMKLSNYETQFLRTTAEAREVLRHAIDSGSATNSHGWLPRGTQLMFLQLAEFCCRHPPRNPKLTSAGLQERAKWACYLDARDTSLALFGSARQSRDSMKHLFYHDNQLPALRSDAVVAKDFADVHRIFFGSTIPPPSSSCASQMELQQALMRTRTTLPHTGSSEASVPRYLWDPAVYNPYPAAQLANNSAEFRNLDGSVRGAFTAAEIEQLDPALGEVARGEEEGEVTDASEFFVELWHALLDKTTSVGSNPVWYLQNTGMYLLLVRCLLHRLDWEAAVHLTRKMSQHTAYNYMMDHELTTIFREIGDPAGCLAFKVATKLFDGRIIKDGPTKRDRFHQEQFN